jgi:hypothetical protein
MIAHAYVHNIWFVYRKMQDNVVLGQVVVQNFTMMYCIHNVYDCHANFTRFHLKATSCVHPYRSGLPCRNKVWLSIMEGTSCCNPTFLEKFPHITTMCMPLWSLCGWQGIWWHLVVHTGMPRLPLIIAYVFFTCHLSSMSSFLTQSCLGCNRIFQFTPYAIVMTFLVRECYGSPKKQEF